MYIVAIFLVITSICNGQTRFSIEIGAGMAMPIGEFSMNKPEQAMMYGWELAPNIPLGLQKEKSGGMAQNGIFLELTGSYKISSFLKLSLQIGRQTNDVNTEAAETFISNLFLNDFSFSHSEYQISYLVPLIEFNHSVNNWQFGLGLGYGPSKMNYPNYVATYIFDIDNNFTSNWQSWGEMDDLKSNLFKTNLSLNLSLYKHINIGVKLTYLQTNFDFIQTTRWVPASNFRPDFEDSLNVQTLNLGVSLGYRF